MSRLLFALFSAVLFFADLSAANPVEWSASVDIDENDCGRLTVVADIKPGWKLYGIGNYDGGPVATEIQLKGDGVELVGDLALCEQPVSAYDDIFQLTLEWWNNKAVFIQNIHVLNKDCAEIYIKVKYMTCDGSSCRPPVIKEMSVKLK